MWHKPILVRFSKGQNYFTLVFLRVHYIACSMVHEPECPLIVGLHELMGLREADLPGSTSTKPQGVFSHMMNTPMETMTVQPKHDVGFWQELIRQLKATNVGEF
jgi:hypothetical protein